MDFLDYAFILQLSYKLVNSITFDEAKLITSYILRCPGKGLVKGRIPNENLCDILFLCLRGDC